MYTDDGLLRSLNLAREEKAGLAFSFGGGSLVHLCSPLEQEHQAIHWSKTREVGLVETVKLFHLQRTTPGIPAVRRNFRVHVA